MDLEFADSVCQHSAKASIVEDSANVSEKAANIEPPAEASNVEGPCEVSNVEAPYQASHVEDPHKASNVEASHKASNVKPASTNVNELDRGEWESQPSNLSAASNISTRANTVKLPQPVPPEESPHTGNAGMSKFARITGEVGLRLPSITPVQDKSVESTSKMAPANLLGSFTKGLFDSFKIALKAVQVKARHIVSQNRRRYQEREFDLDMTYITESIIAMGFPAGDMSSGFFGYFEGFYRNHMAEVIQFFETHHKTKEQVSSALNLSVPVVQLLYHYNMIACRRYSPRTKGIIRCMIFVRRDCTMHHYLRGSKRPDGSSIYVLGTTGEDATNSNQCEATGNEDDDNVFSDSDGKETGASKNQQAGVGSGSGRESAGQAETVSQGTGQLSQKSKKPTKEANIDGIRQPASGQIPRIDSAGASDIKAIAADASVFSFGDDEDYESE